MNYSDIDFYSSALAQVLSVEDIEFYSELADLNRRRANILYWYGTLLIAFSAMIVVFVKWSLLANLMTFRFIRGTFPELVILALPFACLGLYIFYSARRLLVEAEEEIEVMKKAANRQQDESERLQRLQTS